MLAKTLDKGLNFYYDGKFKKAIYTFDYLAKRGNKKASLYLGNMYFSGYGASKNRKKAFVYYKKAAMKGNKSAQLKLSLLYLNGSGVKKNLYKANYWQKKAKRKSYAKAYYQFGQLQEKKGNFRKAFSWYKKASKLDYPQAIYNVGLAYLYGKGVHKNLKKAKIYLRSAYFEGIAKAKHLIDKFNLKNY